MCDQEEPCTSSTSHPYDNIECPICLDIFIEPVTMPCSHTLCKGCFHDNVNETSLNCPLCRQRISNWARNATREGNLVNEPFWDHLQKYHMQRINKKRLCGNSDQSNSFEAEPTIHHLAKEGEVYQEYLEQQRRVERELAEERRREELASKIVIEQLQQQDAALLAVEQADELVANVYQGLDYVEQLIGGSTSNIIDQLVDDVDKQTSAYSAYKRLCSRDGAVDGEEPPQKQRMFQAELEPEQKERFRQLYGENKELDSTDAVPDSLVDVDVGGGDVVNGAGRLSAAASSSSSSGGPKWSSQIELSSYVNEFMAPYRQQQRRQLHHDVSARLDSDVDNNSSQDGGEEFDKFQLLSQQPSCSSAPPSTHHVYSRISSRQQLTSPLYLGVDKTAMSLSANSRKTARISPWNVDLMKDGDQMIATSSSSPLLSVAMVEAAGKISSSPTPTTTEFRPITTAPTTPPKKMPNGYAIIVDSSKVVVPIKLNSLSSAKTLIKIKQDVPSKTTSTAVICCRKPIKTDDVDTNSEMVEVSNVNSCTVSTEQKPSSTRATKVYRMKIKAPPQQHQSTPVLSSSSTYHQQATQVVPPQTAPVAHAKPVYRVDSGKLRTDNNRTTSSTADKNLEDEQSQRMSNLFDRFNELKIHSKQQQRLQSSNIGQKTTSTLAKSPGTVGMSSLFTSTTSVSASTDRPNESSGMPVDNDDYVMTIVSTAPVNTNKQLLPALYHQHHHLHHNRNIPIVLQRNNAAPSELDGKLDKNGKFRNGGERKAAVELVVEKKSKKKLVAKQHITESGRYNVAPTAKNMKIEAFRKQIKLSPSPKKSTNAASITLCPAAHQRRKMGKIGRTTNRNAKLIRTAIKEKQLSCCSQSLSETKKELVRKNVQRKIKASEQALQRKSIAKKLRVNHSRTTAVAERHNLRSKANGQYIKQVVDDKKEEKVDAKQKLKSNKKLSSHNFSCPTKRFTTMTTRNSAVPQMVEVAPRTTRRCNNNWRRNHANQKRKTALKRLQSANVRKINLKSVAMATAMKKTSVFEKRNLQEKKVDEVGGSESVDVDRNNRAKVKEFEENHTAKKQEKSKKAQPLLLLQRKRIFIGKHKKYFEKTKSVVLAKRRSTRSRGVVTTADHSARLPLRAETNNTQMFEQKKIQMSIVKTRTGCLNTTLKKRLPTAANSHRMSRDQQQQKYQSNSTQSETKLIVDKKIISDQRRPSQNIKQNAVVKSSANCQKQGNIKSNRDVVGTPHLIKIKHMHRIPKLSPRMQEFLSAQKSRRAAWKQSHVTWDEKLANGQQNRLSTIVNKQRSFAVKRKATPVKLLRTAARHSPTPLAIDGQRVHIGQPQTAASLPSKQQAPSEVTQPFVRPMRTSKRVVVVEGGKWNRSAAAVAVASNLLTKLPHKRFLRYSKTGASYSNKGKSVVKPKSRKVDDARMMLTDKSMASSKVVRPPPTRAFSSTTTTTTPLGTAKSDKPLNSKKQISTNISSNIVLETAVLANKKSAVVNGSRRAIINKTLPTSSSSKLTRRERGDVDSKTLIAPRTTRHGGDKLQSAETFTAGKIKQKLDAKNTIITRKRNLESNKSVLSMHRSVKREKIDAKSNQMTSTRAALANFEQKQQKIRIPANAKKFLRKQHKLPFQSNLLLAIGRKPRSSLTDADDEDALLALKLQRQFIREWRLRSVEREKYSLRK